MSTSSRRPGRSLRRIRSLSLPSQRKQRPSLFLTMAPAGGVATRVAGAVLEEEVVLVVEGRLNNLRIQAKKCRARCHETTSSVRIAMAVTSVSNISLEDVKME